MVQIPSIPCFAADYATRLFRMGGGFDLGQGAPDTYGNTGLAKRGVFSMTDGNIFYLGLVLTAFAVFGATLVYADWTARH
jgi:hypothetical protein